MIEQSNFEERKHLYIESVEAENIPAEQTYWQYPTPTYHHTRDYAAKFTGDINANEPVTFKRQKKEWIVGLVIVIAAGTLLYIIREKNFGFTQLVFLAVLLLMVLPFLLNNKPIIMISREGIWQHQGNQTIAWKNVLLTYVKEVHGEHTTFSFVIHYYDEADDNFKKNETALNGLVSPAVLATTIEAFRQSKGE